MGFFMDKSELKLKSEGEKLFAKGDKEGAFYVVRFCIAFLYFDVLPLNHCLGLALR